MHSAPLAARATPGIAPLGQCQIPRPMFVLKHNPYPFEGNPTDNPTAGAAQYNAVFQRVGYRCIGSFEGLIDVAQGSVDLAKGILQVYRSKRLTGDFEPFQRGNA